ncbi:MAG: HlyC/CorC family transporter [Dehalococcoidales bacterium]|nr:HlyC/CorC family transporter [Dehalococcoidales bacterium]
MGSTEVPLYVVLLIVCLILSAFFSGSETAFISLQRIRLEHLVSTKVKGAERVARMVDRPDKFLSTVLLGNTFVNTAAAAIATAIALKLWPENEDFGILISTIAATIILLIFSETTPKTVAAHYNERFAMAAVRPLEVMSWLLTPFVFVLSWIASGLTRVFGGEKTERSLATADEIRHMITVGHREGTVEENEAKMLDNVFDFGDRPVREVLIPRPEVIAIEKGSTVADFLALYGESPISRFPVYQENMDNVIGILSIKDVLMGLAKKDVTRESVIDELVRPAYFTPETKLINELFGEMKDNNYRVAVVIDEFGGTAGIVSLSGLVEEIVGPVGDELASAEKDYEIINSYTFQVDGGMRVEDINSEMSLELPESEEYETIAGLILSLLGHIPKKGEQLKFMNVKLMITRMRGMKIEEVLLTKE